MPNAEEVKSIVKEKYQEIAERPAASSCGCGCSKNVEIGIVSEDYSSLEGYVPEADLGLGCGIPTDIAELRPGQTILDLGSGAGNDVFVARRIVGPDGYLIGVDMTDGMVQRANANKKKLGYENVDFRLGDIEQLPVESKSVDVVLSNCVLNLVPDKEKAFSEIFRVLKPGGHFSISDIVLTRDLPDPLRSAAAMIAGCVSGAVQQDEYLAVVKKAGFSNIAVQRERPIVLPVEVLSEYLTKEEAEDFNRRGAAIKSITVYAKKP